MEEKPVFLLIPDGNRRGAERHGWEKVLAHYHGLKNAHVLINAAFDRGIPHFVFWGASYANLRDRSALEVKQIFRLFKQEVEERLKKEDDVRFKVCGSWCDFTNDTELSDMVERLHRRTEGYQGPQHKQLTILFGYDGHEDMVYAIRRIIESGLKPEEVTRETFQLYLMSKDIPNVDLVVRTGEEGEPHWSGAILPWQMYNPELYFTPTLWPDFTVEEFDRVLAGWSTRRRQNGK